MTSKPFAWSYSALEQFENCPKQYYHTRVIKDVKEEKSEQMLYGQEVHLALYKRVIQDQPLTLRFRHLEPLASTLAATAGEKHGELKLALSADYEPREFFDPDVWVRAIIDLLIVKKDHAIILDYKTGKVKDDFTQLKMAAAVLAQYMPEIKKFTVGYVWLKSRNISKDSLTSESLSGVWSGLLSRLTPVTQALATTSFPASPSPLCKWCPVKSCPHFTST